MELRSIVAQREQESQTQTSGETNKRDAREGPHSELVSEGVAPHTLLLNASLLAQRRQPTAPVGG